MPSFKKSAAAAALVSASFVGATTVSSPASLTECVPQQLSWVDGTAPYFLAIIPGGDPSGAPLQNFGEQSGNSYIWTVNEPAGTSVTISVTDSTGEVAYSSEVVVRAGTSTSCLGASGAGAGSGASAGSESDSSAAPAADETSSAATGKKNNSPAKTSSAASSPPAAASNAVNSVSPAVAAVTASAEDASSDAQQVAKFSVIAAISGVVAFALFA